MKRRHYGRHTSCTMFEKIHDSPFPLGFSSTNGFFAPLLRLRLPGSCRIKASWSNSAASRWPMPQRGRQARCNRRPRSIIERVTKIGWRGDGFWTASRSRILDGLPYAREAAARRLALGLGGCRDVFSDIALSLNNSGRDRMRTQSRPTSLEVPHANRGGKRAAVGIYTHSPLPRCPKIKPSEIVSAKRVSPGRGAAGAALAERAIGVWGGIARSDDGRIASKGGRQCEVAHTSTKKMRRPA